MLQARIGLSAREAVLQMLPFIHASAWMVAALELLRMGAISGFPAIWQVSVAVPLGAIVYATALFLAHRRVLSELWASFSRERSPIFALRKLPWIRKLIPAHE